MSHVIVVAERTESLVAACRRARVVPYFARDVRHAHVRIRELGPSRVHGLCIDLRHADAVVLVADLRDEARFFHLPILALVGPSTEEHVRALALGATDAVVATDTDGIGQRLASVRGFDTTRPGSYRRAAAIAHPDPETRRMLARVARRAGFDPVAVDHTRELEALLHTARLPVGALLLHDAIAEEVALEHLEEVPLVVVSDLPRALLRVPGLSPRALVVAPRDVSEELATLLRELVTDVRPSARSSRRILRRGVCSFRPAGTSTATLGGLHDVSADGVYVRTMVPLPDGLDVWLELRPDDDSPWIHLRGVVVWRRRVGDGGLTCPRGFALRLSRTECPARDLEAWDEAYRRLVHAEVPDRLRLV